MKKRDLYTIHFVPFDTEGQIKRFPIRIRYIKFAALFLVFILALLAYGVRDYYKLKSELSDYYALKDKVYRQERQITDFTERINQLNRKFTRLHDFNTKVRIMADIEAPSQTSRTFNVGGSQEVDTHLYAALEKGSDYVAGLIDEQIDQIDRSISLEELRSNEINEYIKDQDSYLRAIPSIWPAKGWLSSIFGYRVSPFTGAWQMHEGIDIATQSGRPIISPADGIVIKCQSNGAYGKTIMIEHGYGYKTLYAHLSEYCVKKGDKVKRGDLIAKIGNTGRSTGSHLHYEVRLNNVPVNPLNFILN